MDPLVLIGMFFGGGLIFIAIFVVIMAKFGKGGPASSMLGHGGGSRLDRKGPAGPIGHPVMRVPVVASMLALTRTSQGAHQMR